MKQFLEGIKDLSLGKQTPSDITSQAMLDTVKLTSKNKMSPQERVNRIKDIISEFKKIFQEQEVAANTLKNTYTFAPEQATLAVNAEDAAGDAKEKGSSDLKIVKAPH